MSVRFDGVAHPPPAREGRAHFADLNGAEIGLTNMGRTLDGGTSVLVEHDTNQRVGTVHARWESPQDGSLRVVGVVHDTNAASAVRSGALRGLSLGTGVTKDVDGRTLARHQEELSLCAEPRRGGCWIDHVDGKRVRSVEVFSSTARKGTRVRPR